MRESPGPRIEPAEHLSAGPDRAAAILHENADEVVRDRTGVLRIISELRHSIAVIAVQSRLCTEPHKSITILKDGKHRIVGKPVGGCEVVESRARLQSAGHPQGSRNIAIGPRLDGHPSAP